MWQTIACGWEIEFLKHSGHVCPRAVGWEGMVAGGWGGWDKGHGLKAAVQEEAEGRSREHD